MNLIILFPSVHSFMGKICTEKIVYHSLGSYTEQLISKNDFHQEAKLTQVICNLIKFFYKITDLSFNNIEVIEGMDKLTKLEDLTLFNNRIQRLENMDSFSELHVFSIGNNNLKDLDNVCMLN